MPSSSESFNKGEFMGTKERSTQRRRGVAFAATALSLALIAGACSSDSGTGTADTTGGTTGGSTVDTILEEGTPVDGGTLRYGLEADVDGLNPTTSALSAPGYVMAEAVFDTLARVAADGTIVPYLAESFTPSADYKSWTVKLRPGIKFTDGADLNADAVLKAFLAQQSAALVGLAVRPFYPDEGAAVKIDDLTVQFNQLDANHYWPAALTSQLGMMPSPLWLDAAAADPTLNQKPVGTGPFVFDSRTADNVTRFVKNPNYWNGTVHLDAVEFYPVPDSADLLDLFNNDGLDALHTTDQTAIKDLKENGTVTNKLDDTAEESFQMINSQNPPFDDVRVRQALAYATPKAKILELIGLGVSRSADQMFTPEDPYYNPAVKQDADQPEKALPLVAAYCAERGTEINPVLNKPTCTDGKVNMEYQFVGPSVVGLRTTEIFEEGWKVAFNITRDEVNQQDHIQQNALGQSNVLGWRQFGAIDPWADSVWLLCRTVGPISLNWPRYCDPARDQILLDAQNTDDPAARAKGYQALVQNMHDAYTYIFINHTLWTNSFNANVHGTCDIKSPEGVALKCTNAGTSYLNTTWMDQ